VPISLSRRNAGYVVTRTMQDYVLLEVDERGRFVSNRHHLDVAVLEILGPKWFDLPFDGAEKPRNRCVDDVLKPVDEVVGSDVFL